MVSGIVARDAAISRTVVSGQIPRIGITAGSVFSASAGSPGTCRTPAIGEAARQGQSIAAIQPDNTVEDFGPTKQG